MNFKILIAVILSATVLSAANDLYISAPDSREESFTNRQRQTDTDVPANNEKFEAILGAVERTFLESAKREVLESAERIILAKNNKNALNEYLEGIQDNLPSQEKIITLKHFNEYYNDGRELYIRAFERNAKKKARKNAIKIIDPSYLEEATKPLKFAMNTPNISIFLHEESKKFLIDIHNTLGRHYCRQMEVDLGIEHTITALKLGQTINSEHSVLGIEHTTTALPLGHAINPEYSDENIQYLAMLIAVQYTKDLNH